MTADTNLARFQAAIGDVRYKDWNMIVEREPAAMGYFLQVRFAALDPHTGNRVEWSGRKWRLSVHMTASEVVLTALKAVLTAEEHEARERFLYRGRAVFGPHIDVEALWEAAARLEVRGGS